MSNSGVRALLLIMSLGGFAENLHCEDFHGMVCYDGCPELKAGLKWAEDQDIRDPYACVGHSREFDQACATYVYERGPAPRPAKAPDQNGGDDKAEGHDDRGRELSDPQRN